MHTTSPPRPVAPRRSGSSTSASRPTRALSAPRAASLSWRRPACGATELRSSSAGSTTSSASSSPPEVTAIRRGAFITAAVGLLFLVGCARSDALEDGERAQVLRKLDELHQRRTLPVVEGQETFELVKEGGGWRLVLDWGGAIPVRFSASTAKTPALDVTTTPAEIRAKPGESFRVTLRAKNVSGHEITTRVGHQIAPEADANFLALLQCPLFLPASFKPGETREFVSEYLLLKDTPARVTAFRVTYEFANDRR